MKKYRLTENHPDFEKFDKLCALAEELGICIYSNGILSCRIGNVEYHIEDIESVDNIPMEFPPSTEVKLTFEKQD